MFTTFGGLLTLETRPLRGPAIVAAIFLLSIWDLFDGTNSEPNVLCDLDSYSHSN